MNQQHPMDSQLQTTWLVWWLMTTTIMLLVAVILLVGESIHGIIIIDFSLIWLRTLFYLAAFIIFLLMNLQRRIMLHPSYYGSQPIKPTERTAHQHYRMVIIGSLVLADSIALLGVMLYLIGDSRQTVAIFALLSLLALIRSRPKRDELNTLEPLATSPESSND